MKTALTGVLSSRWAKRASMNYARSHEKRWIAMVRSFKSRVRSLKSRVNHLAQPPVTRQATRLLPGLAPALMQFGSYWPHDYKATSFSRPVPDPGIVLDGQPVPPRNLWAYYCTSADSYLASGREDCEAMARILKENGSFNSP